MSGKLPTDCPPISDIPSLDGTSVSVDTSDNVRERTDTGHRFRAAIGVKKLGLDSKFRSERETMERRKLEMNRIDDKNSRQVTFSKRRAGLIKKARHLSVLCDVDVAVVVFSSPGKLYEYCSSGTDSVGHMLSRYQKSSLEAEKRSIQKGDCQESGSNNPCTRFRTCEELLQAVRRVNEEGNEVSVTDMIELEEELNLALIHTRSRKTQLSMERISTFHQQVF
ncbi:hypothetical protein L1887_11629 [Cichorium endivia]|nr:hypothetical protein L1887_11629 [Cichorium endivia]